jgi:predicted membrane channel-forming protein YqfA (hemolysin III family)
VALLVVRQPLLYQVIGIAWMAAALGRIISVFLDNAKEPRNFQAIVFEASIGALLLLGNF